MLKERTKSELLMEEIMAVEEKVVKLQERIEDMACECDGEYVCKGCEAWRYAEEIYRLVTERYYEED